MGCVVCDEVSMSLFDDRLEIVSSGTDNQARLSDWLTFP